MKLRLEVGLLTLLLALVGCSGSAAPPPVEEKATDVSTGELTDEQLKHERSLGKPPPE